jgi:outer membrane lipoprotein-sorting protein
MGLVYPGHRSFYGKTDYFAFAYASFADSGCTTSQSETQELVRRIQSASESRPSIEANFLEERQTGLLKQPLRNEGKIWATLPAKIRREISGTTPSATVIDGKNMIV